MNAHATRSTLLLVDDEPHSLTAMRMALEDEFEILTANGADEALQALEKEWVHAIICDQRMPGRSGVEFLTEVRDRWPETVRVIITGYTDASAMMAAINDAGIHQFLTKPWHPDQLMIAARNAVRLFQLARENERLVLEMRYLANTAKTRLERRRKALQEGAGFEAISRAPASPMNLTVDHARRYASFDLSVLIHGETGTGKARLARAMHLGSLRSDKPFYTFNLAGVPSDLAAINLFGAKRGVLPGGVYKVGLMQKADRGTLYLTGIEHAPVDIQLALLRVLTEGTFTPVGGQEMLDTNVRLLTGTSTDLAALVAAGRFLPDLFHALSVGQVSVPPLRQRSCDIAILAQQYLAELSLAHGKPLRGFTPAALEFLENYDWPGNLRELIGEVTRMLVFAQDEILGAELISRHILQSLPGNPARDGALNPVLVTDGSLKERVEQMETRILRETLARHRWNKSRAAGELGLSRVGLRAKLERYGIMDPSGRGDDEDEED